MCSLNANNFYEVAKPLHICSQLIGLTSFSVKGINGKFISTSSPRNIATLIFFTAWNIYASTIVIYKGRGLIITHRYISRIFENGINLVMFCFISITIFINLLTAFTKKRFPAILNHFAAVDEQLDKMKITVDFKQHKITLLMFVGSVTIFLTCFLILSVIISEAADVYHTTLFLTITMCVNIATHVYIIFHFIFLMLAVKLRYRKVNLFFKQMLAKESDSIDGVRTISEVALVHDQLGDATESINKCYGIPVS